MRVLGKIHLDFDRFSLWVSETLQLAGKRDDQDPEELINLMGMEYGFEL